MATTITADQVKKLRDQTGAGMMECKTALTEANGDFEEANTILRKRGLASAAKKAGRAASEGLIGHRLSADHSAGTLVEVNCESDFVARTEDFQQLIEDVLAEIEKAGDAATEAWLKDPDGPVHKRVAAAIAKLGENMAVPRFVRYAGQGYVGQYIHMGGKIGVQVEFAGVTPAISGREEFATLVKEIAMQIAAASPALRVARRGAGRRAREGEGDLPRADGELRQAGQRHRQDRRGQARQLLQAGRAARPGVDPRSEDDGEGRARRRQQGARRVGRRSRGSRGSRSAKRRSNAEGEAARLTACPISLRRSASALRSIIVSS